MRRPFTASMLIDPKMCFRVTAGVLRTSMSGTCLCPSVSVNTGSRLEGVIVQRRRQIAAAACEFHAFVRSQYAHYLICHEVNSLRSNN